MKENWREPEFNILTKEDLSRIILINARSEGGGGGGGACSVCACIPYCGLFCGKW